MCSLLLLSSIVAAIIIEEEPQKNFQGHKPPKAPKINSSHLISQSPFADRLPTNFDWANVSGRNLLTPSWNQHVPSYCGSSYIHSALSSLADRLNIFQRGGSPSLMLSRQTFLNCGRSRGYGKGCDGGGVQEVFGYMKEFGLPDETCQVYIAVEGSCDAKGECMNCMPGHESKEGNCWAAKNFTTHTIKGYNLIRGFDNIERTHAIMSELYARGPLVCGLYTDHRLTNNYRPGTIWDQELTTFDDDVEVVGWGEENGVQYWKLRNSWGTYWGDQGFFRLKRNLQRGLVLDDCHFGVPDIAFENRIVPANLESSSHSVEDSGDLLVFGRRNNKDDEHGEGSSITRTGKVSHNPFFPLVSVIVTSSVIGICAALWMYCTRIQIRRHSYSQLPAL